jgi:AraC-like DNA-binding protein
VALVPGDLTSVDTSRPFAVTSETPFEMLTFSIPKNLLSRDADRLLRTTAVPIGQEAGSSPSSAPSCATWPTGCSTAGEHFISVRRLHKLFADEGLTVSAWIRDRRLERCRRDLADPALAGETVASIAWSWGFRNPGHFSRVYRAAYGCAPSAGRTVR